MSPGFARALLLAAVFAAWAGCGPDDMASPTVEGPPADAERAPVETHQPLSLGAIRTQIPDETGEGSRWVGVRCMTCHGLREEYELPDHDPRELEAVHAGMFYRHGALKCRACHDSERADRLHLADGRTLDLSDALRLCSQCHGPQARDWENGSHGGMRGYWDRRRGPAERNHCVDCHDPHDPRFPSFRPAPPTRDRFLAQESASEGGSDE